MHSPGLDRHNGDGKQCKDQERRDAHGPSISNIPDEAVYHNVEDNAAERGARRQDPICNTALLVKPAHDAAQSWLKNSCDANSTTHTL
jgi:hypothetical protein